MKSVLLKHEDSIQTKTVVHTKIACSNQDKMQDVLLSQRLTWDKHFRLNENVLPLTQKTSVDGPSTWRKTVSCPHSYNTWLRPPLIVVWVISNGFSQCLLGVFPHVFKAVLLSWDRSGWILKPGQNRTLLLKNLSVVNKSIKSWQSHRYISCLCYVRMVR